MLTPTGRRGIVVALELTAKGIEAIVECAPNYRASFRADKLRAA